MDAGKSGGLYCKHDSDNTIISFLVFSDIPKIRRDVVE